MAKHRPKGPGEARKRPTHHHQILDPPRIDVHLFLHDETVGPRVTDLLDNILTRLRALEAQGKDLRMANDTQLAILKRIDTATTNIAADLRRLKDLIGDNPAVTEALEAAATRLEAMANDPENPDPDAPPEA